MRSLNITADGRYELRFDGEPSHCHALTMAPSERETMLNQGTWLVLVFGVWSAPDRRAIDVALAAVKELGGRVRLGVRPMDSYDEIKSWCGEARNRWASPLWLVLKDGALVEELAGARGVEEITELLRRVLEKDRGEQPPPAASAKPAAPDDPKFMAQTSSTRGKE